MSQNLELEISLSFLFRVNVADIIQTTVSFKYAVRRRICIETSFLVFLANVPIKVGPPKYAGREPLFSGAEAPV